MISKIVLCASIIAIAAAHRVTLPELEPCERLVNFSACVSDANCTWNPAQAKCYRSCSRCPTKTTCAAVPECVWNQNECRPACGQIPTQSACASSTSCIWNAAKAKCFPSCIKFGIPTMCAAAPECVWRTSACYVACKYAYTTEAACNSSPYCLWNSTKATCEGYSSPPSPSPPKAQP